MTAPVLLEARDLRKLFRARRGLRHGTTIRALDGVSLRVFAGDTLAVVGESGSGKSTLMRCLLGIATPTSGDITFDGKPVPRLRGAAARSFHRQVQPVFQDPLSSLDPRWTVRRTVREALDRLDVVPLHARDEAADAMLRSVGLPPGTADRRPAALSGGQCQRVAIAAALVCGPRLLIADEPVTALDVSVQAQILNLLDELRQQRELTVLLVSHDLAVVAHVADRVAVMHRGRIVETGRTADVLGNPRHPHTRELVAAMPKLPAAEHRVQEERC